MSLVSSYSVPVVSSCPLIYCPPHTHSLVLATLFYLSSVTYLLPLFFLGLLEVRLFDLIPDSYLLCVASSAAHRPTHLSCAQHHLCFVFRLVLAGQSSPSPVLSSFILAKRTRSIEVTILSLHFIDSHVKGVTFYLRSLICYVSLMHAIGMYVAKSSSCGSIAPDKAHIPLIVFLAPATQISVRSV